jgi:hypothetical protein
MQEAEMVRKLVDLAFLWICFTVALIAYFPLYLGLAYVGAKLGIDLARFSIVALLCGLVIGRLPLKTGVLSGSALTFLLTSYANHADPSARGDIESWLAAGASVVVSLLLGVVLTRLPTWFANRR